MENKHPISEILEESLTKLKQLVDVDTIIGKPITCLLYTYPSQRA